MALTTVNAGNVTNDNSVLGDLKARFKTVTFDNSYTTGGVALTPATLGLNVVKYIQAEIRTNTGVAAGQATHVTYDYTNQKLQLWKLNAEVANATDTSLVVVDLFVLGY
jgi:hypothetical protein